MAMPDPEGENAFRIQALDPADLPLMEALLALFGDEPPITPYSGLGVREDIVHFDIAID